MQMEDRQINRKLDKQVDRQIDRKLGRQIDRQIDRQIVRQIDKQIGGYVLGKYIDREKMDKSMYKCRQIDKQIVR